MLKKQRDIKKDRENLINKTNERIKNVKWI